MKGQHRRLETIERIIRENQIQSFETILGKVDCSSITLRRDIKAIAGITSYTHRGKYITLADIPVFNENGIWFYKKVGFTKLKNSLDLIVSIINNAKEAITTKEEIEDILRIKISKQIQILLSQNRLHRVKLGAKYCYLSEELAKNKERQMQLLDIDIEDYYDKKVKLTDLIAVLKAVLTEYKIDMNNLKKLIRKDSLDVPIKKVEQLIVKYDLSLKKSPSSSERPKNKISK
jgi:uncharacterized protein YqgV (UPF0045/DUF77 family)